MIRAIIVDDEPLAREKVQLFARDAHDIEIIDTCANGFEALTSFQKNRPDLIFLDIQMPEMNGFEFLQQIGPEHYPGIIFITAYDEFALKAFEFHALDYLLKPYDRERFNKAVDHARHSLRSKPLTDDSDEQLKALLHSMMNPSSVLERLIVKTGGRVVFLRIEEIDWMEAAGNYVKLHTGNESHLVRETMNNLEQQLPPSKFIRVHRSTIVNIEKIKELQPYFNGEYKVILHNNTHIIMSRGFKENFTKVLGKPL
ncbi:MAG: response regulator transcription factor [Bacteroidetes bacterium]|nr:response regulator transcription factor [Bacteroidota bacterium]